MATEDLNTLHPHVLTQQLRTRIVSSALAAQSIQQLRTDGASLVPAIVEEQYLVFTLLGYEFAFKAEYIQGVERLTDITPVPNVASWLAGVISLRGSIASVVDLRAFLGMETLPPTALTRLLSLYYNELLICLIVDGVSEMLPIPTATITSASTSPTTIPPWALPYAAGSALLAQRVLILLDAARVLFADKMQRYSTES